MDGRLSGARKRRVDLHLKRCARCRAFYEAERREHEIWFRALNDVSDIPQMSEGFEKRFLSCMASVKAKPFRPFFKWFRRVAIFLVMAGGASYAAWIGSSNAVGAARPDESETGALVQRGAQEPYSYIQDGWPVENVCNSAVSDAIDVNVGARSVAVMMADTGTLEARYRSICPSAGCPLDCTELHGTVILFR